MTTRENLAHHFPLHYQRIVELSGDRTPLLEEPSKGRWYDLAKLFLFDDAEEGFYYWWALATGEGIQ